MLEKDISEMINDPQVIQALKEADHFYICHYCKKREQIERISLMKYTTVKISEIAAHPTMRLDPGYWIKKKKKIRAKPQAASNKLKKSI